MSPRACSTFLLLLLACVTTEPRTSVQEAHGSRLANLQRAAALPWNDEGRCAVSEASQSWAVLVERCYHALDTHRIRFSDTERRCPVALVDGPDVEAMVGICLLTQPELVVGAVVVLGLVAAAVAIHEELEAEALRERRAEEATRGRTRPTREPVAEQVMEEGEPEPEVARSGGRGTPPGPPVSPQEDRPECMPFKIPPMGGNVFHNTCADNVPFNSVSGHNVVVNGKAYDALQPRTRTLWEVKTTAVETYSPFVQKTELAKQVREGRRERDLAAACGYRFVMGVRTLEHQRMLQALEPELIVVLMPWC